MWRHLEVYGSQLTIDFLQEFGDVNKYVCSNIHQSLTFGTFELVLFVDVVNQSRIDESDHPVENVVLKCSTNYLILCQNLVVVPLDGLAGSRCVVYYVSAVKLVESGWHHSVRVISDSGEV